MGRHIVAEAEKTVAELVDLALAGKPVTITRGGTPIAELTPLKSGVPTPVEEPADESANFVSRLRDLKARHPDAVRTAVELVREERDGS